MKLTPKNIDKQIVQKIKKSKHWHHDIEYIDGEFVEIVVMKYQTTGDESLLAKITANYEIYRSLWAKEFCKYLDNDPYAGEAMHDEIVWLASSGFNRSKTIKRDGKAFNAYYVSACLNQLKNFRNARMSHKNHPRIKCPVCGEEVFQIDAAHLRHHYTLDRYRKSFRKYQFSSLDGKVVCPITGNRMDEITESYLNRIKWPDGSYGYYTLSDFNFEFSSVLPKGPFLCPVTGISLETLDNYPMAIAPGYSASKFVGDFPDFPGIFKCPLSGKRILNVTQEHLDIVLDQTPIERKTISDLEVIFPNITVKAKQAPVMNPYTGEMVSEIMLADLLVAKTTVQEHFGKYMKHALDKWYPIQFKNPFTGKNTKCIKRELLKKLNKTAYDFYLATSEYPLKKWQIKCAICGDWVDNIWTHLESPAHSYAKNTTLEEFAMTFQGYPTKISISTNSFYESDSGDSVHISDLLSKKLRGIEPLEVEDSLLSVANDDIDKKIASCLKNCRTIDDVFHMSSEKKKIRLKGRNVNVRDAITEIIGDDDFDLFGQQDGEVEIMIPCRDSIKKRLVRLYQSSDLTQETST